MLENGKLSGPAGSRISMQVGLDWTLVGARHTVFFASDQGRLPADPCCAARTRAVLRAFRLLLGSIYRSITLKLAAKIVHPWSEFPSGQKADDRSCAGC